MRAKLPSSPGSNPTPQRRFGNAFNEPPGGGPIGKWSTASVLSYSPGSQAYLLSTPFGSLRDIPQVHRDPGELSVLPIDTLVAIHNELGFWVIDSVLKYAPAKGTALNPIRITEVRGIGGEDPVYRAKLGKTSFRPPNDPQDLLSSDWVRMSPEGNLIGVLAGGMNVMKSSPLAQVRTNAMDDSVEIISQAFRQITAMGKAQVMNDGGKTSYVWRGGSDQQTENGSNAENWTIWLDVGAEGDLMRFRVTTPQGNTLAEVHMGADGRMSLVGVAGLDITSGDRGNYRTDIGADSEVSVRGQATTTVKGGVVETYKATRTTTLSGNDSLTVGNNRNETINADHNAFIGGKQSVTAMGGGKPGDLGVKYEIVNGGLEVVVGNPVVGGVPSAMQSMNFVSYVGGFNFAIQPTALPPPLGGFNVISLLPNSVQLGANGAAVPVPGGAHQFVAIAPFGVMKFEPWAAMMSTLLGWLDAHTHLTVVGPTTPAAVSLTGPVSPLVLPLIPLVRSLRVCVGL